MSNFSGDAGHNCYPDAGATGIRQEDTLTKEVWQLVQSKLRALGNTVTDCTPYEQKFNSVSGSLGYRVRLANESGSSAHLCIHFNAGGGHGVEVYATSAAGRELAQKICNEISSLGYTNRGVKDGSNLFVVKYTSMPCVLIECSFVDSQDDMNRYNAANIASAIVKALTGQTVASQPAPQPQSNLDNEVLKLQRVLNRLAMRDGRGNSLAEDGIMGTCTKEAIKRFQTICGLDVDGIAGSATWGAINQILAMPLLQIGSTGVVVRYLQYRISVSYDGIFGNLTANNVRYWQSKNDLVGDGIVGNNTWNKLIG